MGEDMASAMEHVRTRLEATFGKALAMLIVASASNAANAHTVGMSREQYLRFCEIICADQRVIDMWGVAGAADALATWRQLAAA